MEGRVWNVRRDTVDLGEAGTVVREYLDHPGAVAVLPMRGEPGAEEVLLIQQYRHPIGAYDWEPPAGLLDVEGEPPHVAAARELYEEADLRAQQWHVLADYVTTPGGSNEAIRIFLARDISVVPPEERHERTDEELGMPTGWVLLDDAVAAVLAGKVHNPSTCVGVLAAHAARAAGWSTLREPDVPWPMHPAHRSPSGR